MSSGSLENPCICVVEFYVWCIGTKKRGVRAFVLGLEVELWADSKACSWTSVKALLRGRAEQVFLQPILWNPGTRSGKLELRNNVQSQAGDRILLLPTSLWWWQKELESLCNTWSFSPMRPSGALGKAELSSWLDAVYKCFVGVGMHVETRIEDPLKTSS